MVLLQHFKSFKMNKKFMMSESRRGQNGKNGKKNVFSNLKKTYFLYCSFFGGPWALHFKDEL
jgi:hypothetical protein